MSDRTSVSDSNPPTAAASAPTVPSSTSTTSVKTNALLCVGAAYLTWGVVGWFFKIVTTGYGVAPFTLLAHRIVWSLVFVIVLLTLRRELPQMLAAFRNRRLLLGLTVTSILVAINWITFIYAAGNGKLKEASLGYFLTPIMNVILGVMVLHESLRRLQVAAVVLAAIGVGLLVYFHPDSIWIPLSLMVSWSCYALLRKQFVVSPIVGLGVETAVLLPAAVAYIGWVSLATTGPRLSAPAFSLLMAAGVITAIPLILFAKGAKHLQLTTIGLLQYIGPTVQFLVATLILKEAVGRQELMSFALIWAGLIVFSYDSYREFRTRL